MLVGWWGIIAEVLKALIQLELLILQATQKLVVLLDITRVG